MVLKPEQERVKTLLRDTITLLCKNGLEFRDKFSVDAVIGVTVDDSDVFLVSMNEIIKSEKSLLQEAVSSMAEEESKNEGREDETELGQRRRRRKRKRHRIKTENGEEEEVSASSDGENSMDNGMDQPEQKRFSSSVEQGGVSKQEPTSGAEEIIDDEDIVVIKEEIDTWGADQFSSGQQGSEGGNPAFFGVHGQQDNEDYGEMSLSGMQDGSWPSSSSHSMSQQGQYHMSSGMSRSATVTSGGGDMTQGQGPQQDKKDLGYQETEECSWKIEKKFDTSLEFEQPTSPRPPISKIRNFGLLGNKNSARPTRTVGFGWLHYDEFLKHYRQVRGKTGGGAFKLVLPKESTKEELLTIAKNLFFPNGMSSKGPLEHFDIDLKDFQRNDMGSENLGQMYDKYKFKMLRFYLTSKIRPDISLQKRSLYNA